MHTWQCCPYGHGHSPKQMYRYFTNRDGLQNIEVLNQKDAVFKIEYFQENICTICVR